MGRERSDHRALRVRAMNADDPVASADQEVTAVRRDGRRGGEDLYHHTDNRFQARGLEGVVGRVRGLDVQHVCLGSFPRRASSALIFCLPLACQSRSSMPSHCAYLPAPNSRSLGWINNRRPSGSHAAWSAGRETQVPV